ncbi:HEAT repeat domain-containing protein [Streptomyces sp. NPDC059850]|uniref:HEAT repeat domain-containing protein n=1 Tax=Streptomyces sp. NPDC059850 TaxID=3346970 RepID=UPI003662C5E6
MIEGEHLEGFQEAVRVVQEELDPWESRILLLTIDDAPNPLSRARAVIRAGLGAPYAFDESFFSHIRDALGDSHEWVREAAVWATSYSPWPQYRPLLEDIARNDPKEKIRGDAAAILAGFDQEGVGNS